MEKKIEEMIRRLVPEIVRTLNGQSETTVVLVVATGCSTGR